MFVSIKKVIIFVSSKFFSVNIFIESEISFINKHICQISFFNLISLYLIFRLVQNTKSLRHVVKPTFLSFNSIPTIIPTGRTTDYSDAVVELLSICVNPKQMPISTLFTVSCSVVSYFFHLMSRENLDLVIKITLINNVKSLLANLCQQSSAQHAVLRMLLEGILDKKYSALFGSKVAREGVRPYAKTNLLNENVKYMSSVTLPQSHSSVFHSG